MWKPACRFVLSSALALMLHTVSAQDSKVADELAKYRDALADGNPADLLDAKGEGLWTEKRGPKNA